MAERPKDLIYALDERPPAFELLALGFQHASAICGEFVADTMSHAIGRSYGANIEAHWYVGRYVLPGNVQKMILKPKPYGAGRLPRHLQA
jgi:hypothetical protein